MGAHCRRSAHRHHRRPFLKVTKAETSADAGAFTGRLRHAIHEAEVLGLPDVVGHLDAALALATRHLRADDEIAGSAEPSKVIGQHDTGPTA